MHIFSIITCYRVGIVNHGKCHNYIDEHIINSVDLDNSIFDFGFWPGGDRDGNPFVPQK